MFIHFYPRHTKGLQLIYYPLQATILHGEPSKRHHVLEVGVRLHLLAISTLGADLGDLVDV